MNPVGKDTKEHRLAVRLADQLDRTSLIAFPHPREKLIGKIESWLTAESQIEIKINADAKALLAQYEKASDSEQIDSHKMFLMIKKKLVSDRNLILQSDPTLSEEDKINHLAHVIEKGIMDDSDIDPKVTSAPLLSGIKKVLAAHMEQEKELHNLVRSRLAKGRVMEGSEEWELLYQRAVNEIAQKRGL